MPKNLSYSRSAFITSRDLTVRQYHLALQPIASASSIVANRQYIYYPITNRVVNRIWIVFEHKAPNQAIPQREPIRVSYDQVECVKHFIPKCFRCFFASFCVPTVRFRQLLLHSRRDVQTETHQSDLNQVRNSSPVRPCTRPVTSSSCRVRASATQEATTASSLSPAPWMLSSKDNAISERSSGASVMASKRTWSTRSFIWQV
jgi:hypothetical protein